MPRKYLIISLVSLVIMASGIGIYYFLGVEEEIEMIPPAIHVIQKVETNTGVSEVVSGEIENTLKMEVNSGKILSTDFSGSQFQIFNDDSLDLSFKYPSGWKIKSTPDNFGGKVSATRIDIQTDDYEIPEGSYGPKRKGNIGIQLFISKDKGLYDIPYGMFFGEEQKKSITNQNGETIFIHIYINYLTSSPRSETSPGVNEYVTEITKINNSYKPKIDAMIASLGSSTED